MKCLVLRDLVGMVDFAMVDAAGVDVERMAQPRLAHHRAFEVPARRALAPGGVPFHLPLLARRGLAPYGEVAGVALARDRIDVGSAEERRVGKECVRTCNTWGWPVYYKKIYHTESISLYNN